MADESEKQQARREAARLMGSVMTPAKRAAVLKAAQFAGRKKGTLQSQETKDKIRASRLKQEAAKQAERAAAGTVEVPVPAGMGDRKRPRLAERLQAGLEETHAWTRGVGEGRVTVLEENSPAIRSSTDPQGPVGESIRRHGPERMTIREMRDCVAGPVRAAASKRDYLVVFEKGENNWSAYAPGVPGCVATGATREETEVLFREALETHLQALREHGEPVPEPSSQAALVSVAARHAMTLTIELTLEQQAVLEAEAAARGLDLPEFARLRLLENLPNSGSSPGRKLRGYGVLAGVGGSVDDFLKGKHVERDSACGEFAHVAASSEEFARRKQDVIRREEVT